jgi:hypothetical protein
MQHNMAANLYISIPFAFLDLSIVFLTVLANIWIIQSQLIWDMCIILLL